MVSYQLPANSTAKVAQIKAALEFGYRTEKEYIKQERIQNPEQAMRAWIRRNLSGQNDDLTWNDLNSPLAGPHS